MFLGKIILTNDLYKFKLYVQENKKQMIEDKLPQQHIAPVKLFQNTSDNQFIMVENRAWKELKNKNAKYGKSI